MSWQAFTAVSACSENREQGGACSPASTDGVPHHEEGACLPTLCTLLSAKMRKVQLSRLAIEGIWRNKYLSKTSILGLDEILSPFSTPLCLFSRKSQILLFFSSLFFSYLPFTPCMHPLASIHSKKKIRNLTSVMGRTKASHL